MIDKVTYILGAGASCNSIPVSAELPERMRYFLNYVNFEFEEGRIKHRFTKEFLKKSHEIIEELAEITPLDAYAKSLYFKEPVYANLKFEHFKILLSCYFSFEQIKKIEDIFIPSGELTTYGYPEQPVSISRNLKKQIVSPIDTRYQSFLTYLLKSDKSLPDSLKIISWNYDIQFELAYADLFNLDVTSVQNRLQIFPSKKMSFNQNKFGVINVNGSAGIFHDFKRKHQFNLLDQNRNELNNNIDWGIEIFSQNYKRLTSDTLISFAFENEDVFNQAREYARRTIKQSSIIVIIGYSFSDFNREVDRNIFKDVSNIKTVYLQIKKEHANDVLERIEVVNKDLLKLIKLKENLDSFYIPGEL